jgi:hypothetical protein
MASRCGRAAPSRQILLTARHLRLLEWSRVECRLHVEVGLVGRLMGSALCLRIPRDNFTRCGRLLFGPSWSGSLHRVERMNVLGRDCSCLTLSFVPRSLLNSGTTRDSATITPVSTDPPFVLRSAVTAAGSSHDGPRTIKLLVGDGRTFYTPGTQPGGGVAVLVLFRPPPKFCGGGPPE